MDETTVIAPEVCICQHCKYALKSEEGYATDCFCDTCERWTNKLNNLGWLYFSVRHRVKEPAANISILGNPGPIIWVENPKKEPASPNSPSVAPPEPPSRAAESSVADGIMLRSSNDQRSDVLNSNNPENRDAADNRANQLNPNNQAYRSSRGKK